MNFHLDPHRIDIWFAHQIDACMPDLERDYLHLLSDEERSRLSRFYFERDRHLYLLTRILVRSLLSWYTQIPAGELRFETNRYGRPKLSNAQGNSQRLTFNLSHTRGLVLLGVACDRQLGVDVERIREQSNLLEVAERFFASYEYSSLKALPLMERETRFYEYWTLKESYIKARSMGLSLALDQFGFTFVADRELRFSVDSRMGDDAARWKFWQFSLNAEFIMAICADVLSTPISRLSVSKVTPVDGSFRLEPCLIQRPRTSYDAC